MVFKKINYIIMVVGIVVLASGFLTMASETAEYGFGNLGLNVGPILILLGFGIEFAAILYRPKEKK